MTSLAALSALVERAGLIALSERRLYRISGEGAESALDYLLATRIAGMAVRTHRRVAWCSDGGLVMGDGTLFRFDNKTFVLMSALPCLAWIEDGLHNFAAIIEDIGGAFAGMMLAGPAAVAIIRAADLAPLADLGDYELIAIDESQGLLAARRGDLSTSAFEFWSKPEALSQLSTRLRAAGESFGLAVSDASAWDGLRLEAAHPLLGVDYMPASLAVNAGYAARPEALGLEGLVDFGKPFFVGRSELQMAAAAELHLVRLAINAAEVIARSPVQTGQETVGFITSASYSIRLGCSLAMAWLNTGSSGPLSVPVSQSVTAGIAPASAEAWIAPEDFGLTQKGIGSPERGRSLFSRMGVGETMLVPRRTSPRRRVEGTL